MPRYQCPKCREILSSYYCSECQCDAYRVGLTFGNVVAASMTKGGAIDLRKMEKLEGCYEHVHGNRGCDVMSGPCACGAWH